jgi:hypothetical protein
LETLRVFAVEQLDDGEIEILARRHAEAMCVIAAAVGTGLRGPEERLWIARLAAELANLGAASRWAVEASEVDPALRVIGPYGYFYHCQLRHQLFDRAAAAVDLEDVDTHPMFSEVIGLVALAGWLAGDHDGAREAIERGHAASSVADGPGLSLPVTQAMTDAVFGPQWGVQGTLIADEQLRIAESADDTWLTTFWTYAGAQWGAITGAPEVEQRAQTALDMAERHGYESLVAQATRALGQSYRTSDPTRARTLSAQAARRARDIGAY